MSRFTYRQLVRDQLAGLLDQLRAGPVSLLVDPGMSTRSFGVYAQEWFREIAAPGEHLSVSMLVRTATLTIQRIRLGPAEVISTPSQAARTLNHLGLDPLEAWAEFCLANGVPLEDVLDAAGGETPLCLPSSVEGMALIQAAARGAKR